MTRFKTLPIALAAALTLAAGGTAYADSDESGNEIAAVLGASTSMAQALAAAEQQTGGQAVKVDVDDDNDIHLYEVRVVSDGRISNVYVDMTSGQVVQTDAEGFFAQLLNGDDQAALAELTSSPTSLAAAIATAEQKIGGKAIEASFDDESGAKQLEVVIAANDVVQQVVIDGTTGNVLKVVGVDNEDDDNDE